MHNQDNDVEENALVLLLRVLSERLDPGDACNNRLVKLADELESFIKSPDNDRNENAESLIQTLFQEGDRSPKNLGTIGFFLIVMVIAFISIVIWPFLTRSSTNSEIIVTDTFKDEKLNTALWHPPSNPSVIYIQDNELRFRVSEEHATKEIGENLVATYQRRSIRSIEFTMTMRSFSRQGEGGVSLHVYMSNGPDHYISITHDDSNAAIEFGHCKTQECSQEYNEYLHATPIHIQENAPIRMKIVWDEKRIELYTDEILRSDAQAEGTPIENLQFELFANDGGAFELAVDDIAITYLTNDR